MTTIAEQPATLPSDPTPGAVTGHWSLTDNPHLLRAFEGGFQPPDERLDPQGTWRESHDVVFCGPQNFSDPHWVYQGWIEISREPGPDGTVSMRMTDGHILGPKEEREWQLIKHTSTHNADTFSSLPDGAEWTCRTRTLGQQDEAARPFAETRETSFLRTENGARFRERAIGKLGPSRHPVPADMPLTTSLGLIEACHRMERGRIGSGRAFGIFKDGTSWCPRQLLKPLPDSTLTVHGRAYPLRGFVHTGTAHLPTFLWFDENGQMVALRKGVLALVANPRPVMKARCPHAS